MDHSPLLDLPTVTGEMYPPPRAAAGFAQAPAPAAPAPALPERRNRVVDLVSGALVTVHVVLDGRHATSLSPLKTQIFRDDKLVLDLVRKLRLELEIEPRAVRLAKGEVRYVAFQVTQDGAIVRGTEDCALLFADRSKPIAAFAISYLFERVEKSCCCCCVA